MMRSKPSTNRAPGVELLITLLGIFIGLGWYIQNNPITLSLKPNDSIAAPAPRGVAGADVAIVLSRSDEARSWDRLNCDQAWINAVEQEVGEYSVVDGASLDESKLSGAAWTIVPRETGKSLTAEAIAHLSSWVSKGGVLILEQPEGPWAELIGTRLDSARQRATRRITSFDAAISRGVARERILTMPLHTTLMPYQPQRFTRGRDYQVLMEVDGNPAIVSIQRGEGRILVLLFDFGRASVAMQQGLPNPDLSLPRPESILTPPGLTVSAVSAINTDERDRMVPWLDLLERNILYLADQYRPVARLWLFPNRYRGVLLATHSESGIGDVSRFMPEWEHANDAFSTTFATATTMSPETLASIRRRRSDVQLQWVPESAPIAPMRSWGINRFRPVQRAMTLEEQRDEINDRLVPYSPVVAGRSFDGVWQTNYFDAWRQLEALGVDLDSSYGPAPTFLVPENSDAGYIFGTGLPFRPIDSKGVRFSVQELPFLLTDGNPGYSSSRVRQLIVESSDAFHTVVNIDWRADTMSRHPSFDALEGWRSAFEMARSQGLWIARFEDYAKFLRYREVSALRSSFSENRLQIQAKIPDVEQSEDGQRQDVVPSISFPARFRGRPVEYVWVNGEPVNVYELFLSGDRAIHVVPLPPGEHRVEVYYGSLADPTP